MPGPDKDVKTKAEKISSVISDLLGQSTHGVPILAGRKTSTMKKLEETKKVKREINRKRIEKRRRIESKIPTAANVNVEFERQLRKLATKGVVALFNAVSKAKRDGSKATSLLKNAQPGLAGVLAQAAQNSSQLSVASQEERSVNSDVSSITASNSVIHSRSNLKRPLQKASLPPAKALRNSSSIAEGWDQEDEDEDD